MPQGGNKGGLALDRSLHSVKLDRDVVKLASYLEASHSGLVQRFRKPPRCKSLREFESLRFREYKIAPLEAYILFAEAEEIVWEIIS